MERTREALTRARSGPAMMVFLAAAYLFSPLLVEGLRAPQYWLLVQSVEVDETPAQASPVMRVDRQIIRPFLANWHVIVRQQEPSGWVVKCTAMGGGNYRVDAALPENLTLDWWTDGQCPTLPPGTYQVATTWEIHPNNGTTKRLTVESNIFEVTP